MKKLAFYLTISILIIFSNFILAQDKEPILENFENAFKQKYLKLGVLVQVDPLS